MDDFHARQIAELDGLARDREGAGDHCLGGDDRCQGGQYHQWHQRPVGRQQEERILQRFGMREQQRALAEIIQQQGRQYHAVPRQPYRSATEMAHVGIQGLTAGDRQHHRTESEKSLMGMGDDQIDGIQRIDGIQHGGIGDDLTQAEYCECREPQTHHRAEPHADRASAAFLDPEQRGQDRGGGGNHRRAEMRRDDFHAFDRAQHGNRWRDHAVAKEQCGGKDPEHADYPHAAFGVLERVGDQCEQGETAAFAAIVGAHD